MCLFPWSPRVTTSLSDVRAKSNQRGVFSWIVTFNQLLTDTDFVKNMREMLRTLQDAYGCPVDVEFTGNFMEDGSCRINLVQCRPFQVRRGPGAPSPEEMPASASIVLETHGPIIGNNFTSPIERIIYVVPKLYGALPTADRYAVARIIGRLIHLDKDRPAKRIMLVGPGRWGTTTPSLGVPVSFAEINTVSVICEIATMHDGLVPDVSLGTHFFNDLVEFNMLYMALYPNRKDNKFDDQFFLRAPNRLFELLPDASAWIETVKVIDMKDVLLSVDSMKQKAVCYVKPQ